ncbi:protein of unknown function [Methylocella tundrae]|uniref:Uncharacterized protein n=1 Tax=Methylocella tundrae TaxID=227605 RepID=A0A4U8Z3S1_METTU|nr:protein of unknown function [Methylocella tundrae]
MSLHCNNFALRSKSEVNLKSERVAR